MEITHDSSVHIPVPMCVRTHDGHENWTALLSANLHMLYELWTNFSEKKVQKCTEEECDEPTEIKII